MKQRFTQMKTILICMVAGFCITGLSADTAKPLYENNFEKADVGKVPDDLMVLGGEFSVKVDGTNKVLELPGAPLDSFAVQFGTGESDNIVTSARFFGTGKGRRFPTFGIGVGGISGWKLQVAPGKKALELIRDTELKATLTFDWKSAEWTHLKLQIRKVKDAEWIIEGKAWQGGAEPKDWTISASEKSEVPSGNCSVFGSPFAGTPIWFDDLRVESLSK
jgi:predicted secreted protein